MGQALREREIDDDDIEGGVLSLTDYVQVAMQSGISLV